jgi:mono/diheme cytochrome c family protein
VYSILLFLHSYIRLLVFFALIWAVFRTWEGIVRKREWNKWDDRASALFAGAFSLQFVLGVLLYLQPAGMAQAGLQDLSAAMKVRELRFFSLEHPIQMTIALAFVHLGRARSRKATVTALKFRWAAICFSLATIAVLTALPRWRPFFRGLTGEASPAAAVVVATESAVVTEPASVGQENTRPHRDPARGAALFKEGVGGQPACLTCHSLTDQRIVGPGLGGIAARAGQRVRGKTADQYLRESILDPSAYIVPDYPGGVMPSSAVQVLTPQQVDDLVAYLLTLK